ncbi:MAG TPA: hypothetical protein VGO93_32070 [Candidatus Xenobia bacterium]|jgi:hypothetical protein
MKQAKGWTLPLLGGALLSLMAVSGCGNGSNASSPFIGFTTNGGTGGNGGSSTTGTTGVAPPYLEVVNLASVAEFSINGTTGALTPLNFNSSGTNGVGNTFQLSGSGGPITTLLGAGNPITGNANAALLVGTSTGVQILLVDEASGLINQVVDDTTAQPLTVQTGASPVALTLGSLQDGTPVMYALLSNSTIQAFTIGILNTTDGVNFSTTITPLNINGNTNSVNTGITSPIQMQNTFNLTSPPVIYVLNQGGGTGSVAAFQISNGTASGTTDGELLPVPMTGSANTITGNGIDVPTSFNLFESPVLGVVVTSQNNTVSTFNLTTTGTNTGALTASGNGIGQNVTTPSSIVTIGNALFITSEQGGTGSVESFGLEATGTSDNPLTLVAGGTGGNNLVSTNVNQPVSSILFPNGLSNFLFEANAGGGTGSIGTFSIDASTLALTAVGTDETAGITSPAVNPQNMLILPGGNTFITTRGTAQQRAPEGVKP